MKYYYYEILCKDNSKRYIGITTNPTVVGLYNRNGGDVTFTSDELNVTKLF